MGFATSHAPSLRQLGYEVMVTELDPNAPVAVVAGKGRVPLIPFEIITEHRKLGPQFAQWCRASFGWTVERRTQGHLTMFYRAYRPDTPLAPQRMDMVDHWGRVHSLVIRGPGEYALAYAGGEKYVPRHIELANTEPEYLTPINSGALDIAIDWFCIIGCQYGLKRLLNPRQKN